MSESSSSESSNRPALETQAIGPQRRADEQSDQFFLDDTYGRYQVIRSLGSGGFGQVFLARDPALSRSVAIKVPKYFQQLRPDVINRFLEEGRLLAKLAHPAVVSVYDVGTSQLGQPFVVMEFVSGCSLSQRLNRERLSLVESIDMLACVADGLRAMHQAQVVHRDLKPGNIVIDAERRVRIIDFGLALNDGIPLRLVGRSQEGTPAYMAPEQVRGLNHQIDGRTDLWAFGVVMYLSMTGKMPFGGRRTKDLGYRICSVDPQPPRQLNNAIPAELERICLRCLSKSMSDRYETAGDLLQDLQVARGLLGQALDRGSPATAPTQGQPESGSRPAADSRTPRTPHFVSTVGNVMTHGLCPFGLRDAEYFLELLPGQRDVFGIPETIGFWQHRLDDSATEKGLPFGLIYGPSGCGKTSFVCAGLLPRLSRGVDVVYVECDPRRTEARLGHQLDSKYPSLSSLALLEDKMRQLRLDTKLLGSRRVVLVFDQFEQWLRPSRQLQAESLVEALRQADGSKISCLIMVRDDYWMGITQLFRALDQRIQEGVNAMAYPLFDRRHAEKILATFGQSLNCLPRESSQLTHSHKEFIRAAVKSFSRNGKVICVHLAMFAQMMRDRPWAPSELKRMGGWKGIGVRYLEETFSDPDAPRALRRFLPEVSAILERLLPVGQRDIKGGLVAESELKRVANLDGRPDDFEQVIDILLSSTRLITQADLGRDPQSTDERHYQLSHDFLVGPIREWREKQRLGSWRGRAHLRLVELSREWEANGDPRFLPSTAEWVTMMMGVSPSTRGHYAKFLAAATKRQIVRWSTAALLMVAVASVVIGATNQGKRRAGESRAEFLIAARSSDLERALGEISRSYAWSRPRLDQLLANGNESMDWRIHLARLQNGDRAAESMDRLIESVARIPQEDIPVIIESMAPAAEAASHALERQFASTADPGLQSRIATILLFLGRDSFARRVLALGSDPIPRTLFIKNFAPMAGDLTSIAEVLHDGIDHDFEGGLCLAVGRIPTTQLTPDERSSWTRNFRHVYVNSPAAGSHSAAQWALSNWGEDLPPVSAQPSPPADKDWWIIEPLPNHRLTLVRIPAGTIVSGESLPDSIRRKFGRQKGSESVAIPSFWISSEEVGRGIFQAFLDSRSDASNEHLDANFSSGTPAIAPETVDDEFPAYSVNWENAALFCNWLSDRCGRSNFYDSHHPESTPDATSNGFRLPRRIEAEYACLAEAKTMFPFGGAAQIDSLRDYSWYSSSEASVDSGGCPRGRKMPNGWGLFDMLGNADEWCTDGPSDDEFARYRQGGGNNCAFDELYAGLAEFDLRLRKTSEFGVRIVLPAR